MFHFVTGNCVAILTCRYLVPIVLHFLELLQENKVESQVLSFSDIFGNSLPTHSVLNHFKQHFGFELESLQWQYERKVMAAIVEKTFDSLAGKMVSSLLSYHNCDVVLLSGRPSSLKPLTDLFLKHYAISPNRLKTMNDYRVGRWYPEDKRYRFISGNGKFINPKSIITTGAMIGHIAENGGMNGFSLNLQELKEKLLPTTHYLGRLNDQLQFTDTLISPDINRVSVEEDRGIGDGLVRLSVGLEEARDLIADIDRALTAAAAVTVNANRSSEAA